MRVVLRQMIDHAGQTRMHVAAAQVFRADHFASRGLHQRRAAEKNRPLVLHDDRLVAHRRHIRAARRARTHHHRDLRNAGRGQVRLVVEDAPEVIAIGEHVVLIRQIRAAGIHQIHARQMVFRGDLLGAHVLLHRHRIVRAALHRGVVADNHALLTGDAANAGDHAGARRVVVIHAERRQLRQFQERRARIEQLRDPVARQQLAAPHVLVARGLAAAQRELFDFGAQVGNQCLERGRVVAEIVRARIQLCFDDRHCVALLCAAVLFTARLCRAA